MISDRDTIITVAGGSKKEYLDKQVGQLLEGCMENRKTILKQTMVLMSLAKIMTRRYPLLLLRRLFQVVTPSERLSCSIRTNR